MLYMEPSISEPKKMILWSFGRPSRTLPRIFSLFSLKLSPQWERASRPDGPCVVVAVNIGVAERGDDLLFFLSDSLAKAGTSDPVTNGSSRRVIDRVMGQLYLLAWNMDMVFQRGTTYKQTLAAHVNYCISSDVTTEIDQELSESSLWEI
ncbi:hypothetical protein MKZ38_002959 [Zalerion maritima]|uniref:Uncharacterized protein n=1 Tax=Zalerion maritima TaxID=339359 RepID=A0AAD5WQW4_9PEZI|nr:hypothetical protein MKZ38_002959 [Zalerion maritima]